MGPAPREGRKAREPRSRLRFAETLRKDGMLYTANLRSARAEDVFILRGDSVETFEPRFTYHGFRYVEVKGAPGAPDPGAVEGKVVHDDVEPAGTFSCSNAMINKIFGNVVWGVLGNYRSMPTDCPQRDERQGWLGDRAIGSKGESFLFDIHALYRKWMNDIRDSQTEAGSIPDVVPDVLEDLQRQHDLGRNLRDSRGHAVHPVRRFRRRPPPLSPYEEVDELHDEVHEGRAHDQGHVRRLVRAARVARPDPFPGSQTDDARGAHRDGLFLS